MRRRTLVGAAPAVSAAAISVPFLTACGGAAPSNASGATNGTPAARGVGTATKRSAVIELDKGGSITMELFTADAPKWIENFVQKATAGFYNNLRFHRVEDWVVQGGDPSCLQYNPADPGPCGTGGSNTIPTETSKRPFTTGSAGVARRSDPRVSNDAQFFFVLRPGPTELGGKWTQLDEQYTHFGQVTEGMDLVRKIVAGDKIKRITIKG